MSTDNLASGWAKALGSDRKQFDMFFDRMLDGFAYHKIVVDKAGKPIDYVFLEVNRAFEKLTGLKREKIVGKKATNVLPGIEKDPADWINVYGKVALTCEPVHFENCAEALGKWYKVSAYCPEKGYFVTLFEDITERKKAEEALKKVNEELEKKVLQRTAEFSNERLRLYNVLETLPAYIILLDKDYRVPFANKVFRERFGESHGNRCYGFLFKRESPCEKCETYKVLKINGPHRWEWTGPDGRDYDIYDFPFVETDGSTLILEMGIDITERKKAEVNALESARKLKDAERLAAIGATAGMVGHDIRNPLQAIINELYFAKQSMKEASQNKDVKTAVESIDFIQEQADYISKIVTDLQDFARPLKPEFVKVDLSQFIRDSLKEITIPDCIESNLVLCEGQIPEILLDRTFMTRIITNLVTNAVQAMPHGGKLTVKTLKEDNFVSLIIGDTGVGIPDALKHKLFTPLFTTKSKGQGFGLSVVKRMTESVGGTITFESQEGKGTIFIIRLPYSKKQ